MATKKTDTITRESAGGATASSKSNLNDIQLQALASKTIRTHKTSLVDVTMLSSSSAVKRSSLETIKSPVELQESGQGLTTQEVLTSNTISITATAVFNIRYFLKASSEVEFTETSAFAKRPSVLRTLFTIKLQESAETLTNDSPTTKSEIVIEAISCKSIRYSKRVSSSVDITNKTQFRKRPSVLPTNSTEYLTEAYGTYTNESYKDFNSVGIRAIIGRSIHYGKQTSSTVEIIHSKTVRIRPSVLRKLYDVLLHESYSISDNYETSTNDISLTARAGKSIWKHLANLAEVALEPLNKIRKRPSKLSSATTEKINDVTSIPIISEDVTNYEAILSTSVVSKHLHLDKVSDITIQSNIRVIITRPKNPYNYVKR